jgi:hypothetical protein
VFVSVGPVTVQAGGTDVVEIPDVFLPAEEYLDMFDS